MESIGLAERPSWLDATPELAHKNDELVGVYGIVEPHYVPYDHQKKAADHALSNIQSCGFHALFMEMGTGKTKVTIDTWMALVKLRLSDALLVVCPKSIMSTWVADELPLHLTIPARILAWDGKHTKKSQVEFDSFFSSPGPIIYVVNVEAFQVLNEEFRQRISKILRGKRALIAIDESSTIKGPDAKRTKHLVAAGKLAIGKLILTGTEISKSPLDLYSQFEFLKPGFWGIKSFFMFKQRYAKLQDCYGAGQRVFKKVVGYQRIQELVGKIEPYTTRALKKDCLDLPESIFQTIKVDLTAKQKKAYEDLKKYMATLLESGELMTVENKISMFTKFRQITGGTIKTDEGTIVIEDKPEKLQALLDDLSDTDESAVIFCAFQAEVAMIAKALSEIGPAVTFDGTTDIEARDAAKAAFQSGEARFFVGGMKAGGFGLNLQANCHLMYFYSRDTSPAVNWQAQARIDRPGQKYACVYKSLVCRDTVDERIHALLDQSTDLRDLIRDAKGADIFDLV